MISIAWKENNPVTYCVFFLVHTFVLFFFSIHDTESYCVALCGWKLSFQPRLTSKS